MLSTAGCVHGQAVLTPESPPTFSRASVYDYGRLAEYCKLKRDMGLVCEYAGVLDIIELFYSYACDNEALAGRDMSGCDMRF